MTDEWHSPTRVLKTYKATNPDGQERIVHQLVDVPVAPPVHEYRGRGIWNLGCECEGCARARDEVGGFLGLVVEHQGWGDSR